MLRGAIDYVTPERIGGWIYADNGSVQQHTILAFVDDVCIGAGRVDRFRQDLADVGFGDGMLGFEFAITPSTLDAAERVVVKLEGSDLILVQPGHLILPPHASCLRPASIDKAGRSLDWMRARGWLDQSEIDLIRSVSQSGVYDLSLIIPAAVGREGKIERHERHEPHEKAALSLSLLSLEPVPTAAAQEISGKDFASERVALLKQFSEPVVAVRAQSAETIVLVEGSQAEWGLVASNNLEGAVEYRCGPDRLLFVDLRCRMGTDLAFKKPATVFGVPL